MAAEMLAPYSLQTRLRSFSFSFKGNTTRTASFVAKVCSFWKKILCFPCFAVGPFVLDRLGQVDAQDAQKQLTGQNCTFDGHTGTLVVVMGSPFQLALGEPGWPDGRWLQKIFFFYLENLEFMVVHLLHLFLEDVFVVSDCCKASSHNHAVEGSGKGPKDVS